MIAQHFGFHRFVEAYHPQAPMADMDFCGRCFEPASDCSCWDDPALDPEREGEGADR